MVQVLEARGYLANSMAGEGFELTNKLFYLGIGGSARENLLTVALPIMQKLSDQTFQSCHLVVATDDQIVVVARIESPGNLGFSVRVGFRQPIVGSTSGLILYAFQRPHIRERWRDMLSQSVGAVDWATFESNATIAATQGYMRKKSYYTEGITDISCPIFSDNATVAALTMPTIKIRQSASTDECLVHLRACARLISSRLGKQNLDEPELG